MAEIEPAKRLIGHEYRREPGRTVFQARDENAVTRLCAAGRTATKAHRETPLLQRLLRRVALHFYRSYLSCDFASPIDQSQKDVSCGMVIVGKTH